MTDNLANKNDSRSSSSRPTKKQKTGSSDDFSDDHHDCEISQELYLSRDLNDDIFWDCVGPDSPCYPVGSTLTTYRFAGIMSERAKITEHLRRIKEKEYLIPNFQREFIWKQNRILKLLRSILDN